MKKKFKKWVSKFLKPVLKVFKTSKKASKDKRRVKKPVAFAIIFISGLIVIGLVYFFMWPDVTYNSYIVSRGEGKNLYTNDNLKFALTYPQTMKLVEDGDVYKSELEIKLFDPADKVKKGFQCKYNKKIDVRVKPVYTGLENIVNQREDEIKRKNGKRELRNRKIIITGVNGIMIEPFECDGKKQVEAYLIKDGKLFTIIAQYNEKDIDYFSVFTDVLMGLQIFRGDEVKI